MPTEQGRVQLTHNRAMDYHAAWSPDGTRTAFNREVDHRQDLWVINPDGSDPTNLTPGPLQGGSPSWSPDGTKIGLRAEPGDLRDGRRWL